MSTKKAQTRRHILTVSYGLFAGTGFSRITMKDICDATGLSRGGLYSHFGSTVEVFEAILVEINQKEEMNFAKEIAQGTPAREILRRALELMEYEMHHSEDSLSLAMYEYACNVEKDRMEYFTRIGEEKWTDLIEYGIKRGEFRAVNVKELVDVILYAYQGLRMWSRIVTMDGATFRSITGHIWNQLCMEEKK